MSLRSQCAHWPWQSVTPKPPLRKGEVARSAGRVVPHRTSCYTNASGGVLSVTSDRKYPKNAAKTNGFGFLARARCGIYWDLSPPRITHCKPTLCFRTVSASIHRDALRACAACPNRENLCIYRAVQCWHRPLHTIFPLKKAGPRPAVQCALYPFTSSTPKPPRSPFPR